MLGRAQTVAVIGLEAVPVTVEANVGPGLPGFHVIGSSGTAARQAADRVRTALLAAQVQIPQRKILVSLAPAEVPKVGARFDLAMAAALLAALGVVPEEATHATGLLGELALDGTVRPVPGVLPSAGCAAACGLRGLAVADANAAEAALVDSLDTIPVSGLGELIGLLRGECLPRPVIDADPCPQPCPPDLGEVRGQHEARRALEIAAAGGHHLLLLGPPGCGKSMLARRLPGILPPLTEAQALELASIRSVAGMLGDGGALDRRPPFRAPHHGGSVPALLGGGSGVARPGELSLAHRGVLFMDELFEWPRSVLEALREPLEEGIVRVARAKATVTYPARVQLVCAANPCPCGGGPACSCGEDEVWAYRSRLSGPLADRLDLAPAVAPLTADDLLAAEPGEPTSAVAARVTTARAVATQRWGGQVAANAEAPVRLIRRSARPEALMMLARAVERGELTGRGYDRALRVARTCADLAEAETVEREHVLEAMAHRLALRRR